MEELEGDVGGGRERRRRVPGGRRHRHTVRFCDEEQERIEAAAAAAGMSVPNLVASAALATLEGDGRLSVTGRRALAGELARMHRRLVAIGAEPAAPGAVGGAVLEPLTAVVAIPGRPISRNLGRGASPRRQRCGSRVDPRGETPRLDAPSQGGAEAAEKPCALPASAVCKGAELATSRNQVSPIR